MAIECSRRSCQTRRICKVFEMDACEDFLSVSVSADGHFRFNVSTLPLVVDS